jgi:formylglycine-generating enzyme required for sulfatase activity
VDFHPDSRPFHKLIASIHPILEPKDLSYSERLSASIPLANQLRIGDLRLVDLIEPILQRSSVEKGSRLLIIADQFEELFTLCEDPERKLFLDNLMELVEHQRQQLTPSITLLIILRADFYRHALTHGRLANVLGGRSFPLGPMTRSELRQTIEKPAKLSGVGFEAGLVERILNDVGDDPGRLPLLEFALTLLWERQKNRKITHAAYADIQELSGALAQHAENVFTNLSQAEQKLAQKVLVQLVHPGEESALDTRRYAVRSEFSAEEWALVQKLVKPRLVVTGRDPENGNETVEIIHETLINHWERLKGWIASDRIFRDWQDRTRVYLHVWHKDRDPGALLHGALLSEAENWLRQRGTDLSEDERIYIQCSIEQRDQAAREREAQIKARMLTYGVIAVLSILFTIAFTAWIVTESGFNPFYYAFGRIQVKFQNPFIPLEGGNMVFGPDELNPSDREQVREIRIDGFSIQRTEVTNHQYRVCRLAGGCSSDPFIVIFYNPQKKADQKNFDDHPVVYVTAFQAREFCNWLGGDLPTSAEWERAARGLYGRPWPWGYGDLTPDRANIRILDLRRSGTVKVTEFSDGATPLPEGVLNLVGNVSEWTSTVASRSTIWDGINIKVNLVSRGGSYLSLISRITEADPVPPGTFSQSIGFRCVRHNR